MRVITNNVPRDIIYGYELTEKEREEFDYLDFSTDDAACRDFVRYKGEVIDLGDLEFPTSTFSFEGWDAYRSDSFFSGILVKFVNDEEKVIMGRYYA